MNHLKYCLVCCLCWLLLSCNFNRDRQYLVTAQVRRVISGQTVEVTLLRDSSIATVRIIGIDAPDFRQSPWGKNAQTRLSELVAGGQVQLEIEDETNNTYNRIYAHLWQNNQLISQKLVAEGCVLANTKYPHSYSKLLINAGEYARLMGLGIWNPQQALRQTPNQFRLKNK